jgi:hypothetical protein
MSYYIKTSYKSADVALHSPITMFSLIYSSLWASIHTKRKVGCLYRILLSLVYLTSIRIPKRLQLACITHPLWLFESVIRAYCQYCWFNWFHSSFVLYSLNSLISPFLGRPIEPQFLESYSYRDTTRGLP